MVESPEVQTIVDNLRGNVKAKDQANEEIIAEIGEEFNALAQAEIRPICSEAPEGAQEEDFPREMVNFFVRCEVQRRYFNIVGVEMLSKSFGMKMPSALEALMERQIKISMDRLIKNGRNLTVEHFLETKADFNKDERTKAQLIRDRETFVIYKGDQQESESSEPEPIAPASNCNKMGVFS